MNSVNKITDCYGCGVCAYVCPKNIISIRQNTLGFYEPFIDDETLCVSCGLCKEVCSFSSNELAVNNPVKGSYSGWTNDAVIRSKCSSGGVSYELSKYLITQGYKVCETRYNAERGRAEHFIASSVCDLEDGIGSKYIQSYTLDALMAINLDQPHLFIGTPCQVDSFRRSLRIKGCEEKFILVDFFCHGVPSMIVWEKYCRMLEKEVGNIISASWRNKHPYGWHNSYYMKITGDRSSYESAYCHGDDFFTVFFSDSCLGRQCVENCKFKYDRSSADIRIGDLWGSRYKDNEAGVSAVVTFTSRGDELIHKCECTLNDLPLEIVLEKQMKNSPSVPSYASKVWKSLKSEDNIHKVARLPRRERKKIIWEKRLHHMLKLLRLR